MLPKNETIEPNLIVLYRPILTSASQPMKGAKNPEKNSDPVVTHGEVKCKKAAQVNNRLLEKENNTCHTSKSNNSFLQHERKD